MAHLTCASQSRDQLRRVVGSYAEAGVRHILAIRGDMPGGPTVPFEVHPEGLANATELVALVSELGGFCIGVAAFPDLHPERHDAELDARVLVEKPQAGASFAITQLFFTAARYFELVDRVRALGCDLPIIPGIMPVTNLRQIQRFAELSGAELPASVTDRMQAAADDDGAVRKVGIDDRHRAVRAAAGRRCARPALHHPEPFPGDPGDLRQPAPGAASSVTSRWVGRVSAT